MAVTIRELSKHCGMSISTVSKALNGYSDISAATRAAVEKAAKELGYYPNSHARALKTKRTYNLGVLFADDNESGLTHSYFSAVLEAFKKTAESNGFDVTFISHNIGVSRMTYLEHCNYREVDGVCIACVNFSDPEVAELVNSPIPVITIDHLFNNRSCIQSNNAEGMRMLVEYVYGMGHRRIGYIHGPRSAVTDTRLGSFYRTMESLGATVDENLLAEAQYVNPASAYQTAKRLLARPTRPTCLLVCDDYASLGVIEAINDAGLRIPDDISVAGFDGIDLMQLVRPRITTIKQDTHRIGAEAALRLVQQIRNPKLNYPEIVVVPCSLIEGKTVVKIA